MTGFETKAVRQGRMNVTGAHVLVRGEEVWLLNAEIAPYQAGNAPQGYEQDRTRKLLLKKSEIKELLGKSAQKGLTILPLKVYNKGRRLKLLIGVARGKKQYEKRETIKKRAARREIGKALRRQV